MKRGVLQRKLYQEHPPRHEYHLTDKDYDAAKVAIAVMPFATTTRGGRMDSYRKRYAAALP